MMNDEGHPPLQFRLRTLFVITAGFCVLFATLDVLDVPAVASFIVLAVLGVGALAAVALVVAIAGSMTGEEEDDDEAMDDG